MIYLKMLVHCVFQIYFKNRYKRTIVQLFEHDFASTEVLKLVQIILENSSSFTKIGVV